MARCEPLFPAPRERLYAVSLPPFVIGTRLARLFLLTIVGLSLIYRFGPSRRQARWRWLSWGRAAAASVWIGGSMLFSWGLSRSTEGRVPGSGVAGRRRRGGWSSAILR
ncbi:MAG: YhjD/YihY/BrkB family envelope integrity protein [Inquilinus sp.]|uniref:YhjD/YihY/BrkB family envelope integrity protein n=1 Tax=Inquilinus sp. TaxID=1932117 RepID=UPI003F35FA81